MLASKELTTIIDELESQLNSRGESLAIKELMSNKLIVEAGQTFKGSVYHTDLAVMEKYAQLDPMALATVKSGQSTIGDFFK